MNSPQETVVQRRSARRNPIKQKKNRNPEETQLKLNVVTFKPLIEPFTVSFYKRKPADPWEETVQTINGRHLPTELEHSVDDDERIFTRFREEKEAPLHCLVDPRRTNSLFIKAYLLQKILNYVRDTHPNVVIRRNFINRPELWIQAKSKERPTEGKALRFHKIGINLTMGRYGNNMRVPELLIQYNGLSDVLTKTVADTGLTDSVREVIHHKRECVRLSQLNERGTFDPTDCYPVVNEKIRKELNLPDLYHRVENRYLQARKKISLFYKSFIQKEEFVSLTGLVETGFLMPEEQRLSCEDLNRHPLLYGQRKRAKTPYFGLLNHGPYASAPETRPWVVMIAPKGSAKYMKQKIVDPLINGTGGYPGLAKFVHLNAELLPESILYSDRKHPAKEVIRKLECYPFPKGRRGVALLFSSIPKHDPSEARKEEFFRIKEKLLQMGIVSQGYDEQKVRINSPSNLMWWHQNVATAILAKLGGVPWKAGEATDDELIIGVGAFKPLWSPNTFVGSAFSFDNSGRFKGFDFFDGDNILYLCGGIRKALAEFIRARDQVRRVVIHFYKELRREDEEKILKVFYDLNCDVPVYLVTINKTFGHDEVVIDGASDAAMPLNGTWIDLHRNRYLLFNNERTGSEGERLKSFPFPLKLSVKKIWNDEHRSLMMQLDPEERAKKKKVDDDIVSELMAQVIRFSRMYWRSVKPQPLPVTIAYPDMLARQVCRFEQRVVPFPVKDLPFFL